MPFAVVPSPPPRAVVAWLAVAAAVSIGSRHRDPRPRRLAAATPAPIARPAPPLPVTPPPAMSPAPAPTRPLDCVIPPPAPYAVDATLVAIGRPARCASPDDTTPVRLHFRTTGRRPHTLRVTTELPCRGPGLALRRGTVYHLELQPGDDAGTYEFSAPPAARDRR
jgi:hypothetical protein